MVVIFTVCAVLFGFLLHKTTFGRCLYGMGNNQKACLYSGINTGKVLLIEGMLTGLMAGFTAIFLTSRMGSTRPNVALGGVSTSGEKGASAGRSWLYLLSARCS